MIKKALKVVCFLVLVLMLGIPSLAQNTKGDKSAPATRDSRFKTPKKSNKKSRPARRIRRQDNKAGKRSARPARTRTRKGDRVGKPIRPTFHKSQPRDRQKAWKGDITGRRIRPRSSSSRAHNVYPQPDRINYSSRNLKRILRNNKNPNVKRVRRMQRKNDGRPRVGKPIRPTFHKSRPRDRQRAWKGDITGRPIRTRRSDNISRRSDGSIPRIHRGRSSRIGRSGVAPRRYSGRAWNIFSQNSFYVNNRSRKPARWTGMSPSLDPNKQRRRVRGGRIIPRSASAAFLRSRSINTWAHFNKPKRPRAPFDRDLAGHRLRSKNYETPRLILTNPTLNYLRRVPGGDRPYKGPGGGYVSRTRSGRAWRGDIAHWAIRGGKSPRGGDRAFLGFLKGGGFRSATKPGPGKPLRGRRPGQGAKGIGNFQGNIRVGQRGFGDQGEGYSGNIRAGKRVKGGGSVSGRVWNNNGQPIQGRTPGKGSRGIGYSGNIRVGRRGFRDQGEGYSGHINVNRRHRFKDQGEEYSGNINASRRHRFRDQGEEYTGNIKATRPDKGGGSRGGHWNNNNTPIHVRTPKGSSARIAGYQGNIRRGRRAFRDQGEEYTGNIKARRPDKGGGSRGGHWNNNNTPIHVRTPKGSSARIAGYQGNIRRGRRGFRDQGEEYTGNIKARRPDKGGGSVSGKLWNNKGQPIVSKTYADHRKINRYSGNIKARRPEKGGGSVSGGIWNNNERPLPGKDYSYAKRISRYSGNIKAKRPEKGGKGKGFDFDKAGVAIRGSRRSWDLVRNPSSADEAQKTREPGRAFARSVDYQGNLKFKRFDLFGKSDLHPDAQFMKLNRNNVPEEKSILTNFKLWWARLFRKSETQPDHLKEEIGKPRYDKGEAGLWYE